MSIVGKFGAQPITVRNFARKLRTSSVRITKFETTLQIARKGEQRSSGVIQCFETAKSWPTSKPRKNTRRAWEVEKRGSTFNVNDVWFEQIQAEYVHRAFGSKKWIVRSTQNGGVDPFR